MLTADIYDFYQSLTIIPKSLKYEDSQVRWVIHFGSSG